MAPSTMARSRHRCSVPNPISQGIRARVPAKAPPERSSYGSQLAVRTLVGPAPTPPKMLGRAMATRQTATLVCGNAGVGKSTLGARLAAERRALLLDMDTCSERLVRLVLRAHGLDENDRDSPEYKRLLRAPVYETVFDIAHANLAHAPAVIVGPFTQERRDPHWPAWLGERLGAPI